MHTKANRRALRLVRWHSLFLEYAANSGVMDTNGVLLHEYGSVISNIAALQYRLRPRCNLWFTETIPNESGKNRPHHTAGVITEFTCTPMLTLRYRCVSDGLLFSEFIESASPPDHGRAYSILFCRVLEDPNAKFSRAHSSRWQ